MPARRGGVDNLLKNEAKVGLLYFPYGDFLIDINQKAAAMFYVHLGD